MTCELDSYKTQNFCSQCGRRWEDRDSCPEYIEAQKKQELRKALVGRCPYLKRWAGNIPGLACIEAWVDWHLMSAKQFQKNYPELGEPIKVNGNWTEKKKRWRCPSPSNSTIIARKISSYDMYFKSREIAKRMIARVGRHRYVPKALVNKINNRCCAKYGPGGYKNADNYEVNIRFGHYARGIYSPVNVKDRSRGLPINCAICSKPIGSGYLDPEKDELSCYLRDYWDDEDFSVPELICSNPLCIETTRWQAGLDTPLMSEAKQLKIFNNRPSKRILDTFPKEKRGILSLAKMLDHEARLRREIIRRKNQ